MVVFGISYSACHDSKADAPAGGPTQELRKEISQFEQELTDLRKVHEDQIKQYSNEMGCIGESKTLEIINAHNALLDHFKQRLEYHKLQMIQADTTNSERNKHQLEELKKDEQELTNNSEEIRNGLEAFTPTHVTK
jgi:hypothetical protein